MSSEISTLFRVEGDESAKANSISRYTLYSEDENGYAKDVPVHILDGWLRGPTNLRGRITRSDIGRYSVEFILSVEPGVYHLDATMNGRPIFRKGDIQLEVTAHNPVQGKLDFVMDGSGLYGGRVGEYSDFTIKVTDDYGKPYDIDVSGLKVVISSGHSTTHAQVNVEQIGKYKATFVVNQSGEYHIDILYDNRTVLEKNAIKFSNATDPSRSVITHVPDRVRSNTDVHFGITSKDSRGQPIYVGGDHWEALVTGPERVSKLIIQDNDNGTYGVTTLLPLQGVYSFAVRCNGEAASNSPITIRVD